MIRTLSSVACIGLVFFGTQVFADDSMSRAVPTPQQMMKDCIEKQKTADVTMSKAAMKRICKDQMQRQKATGALPEPPPTDAPQT